MSWQPIETAPKSDAILLWRNNKCDIGYYIEDNYARKPKPYWFSYYHHYVTSMRQHVPTHWQPLPSGPGEDAS